MNGVGDTPNRHDMLTGSQLDGTAFTDGADHTCGNWTSGAAGTAQLGHHDPPVAAIPRGTLRTPAAAAARKTWSAPAAPACSTASPSTDRCTTTRGTESRHAPPSRWSDSERRLADRDRRWRERYRTPSPFRRSDSARAQPQTGSRGVGEIAFSRFESSSTLTSRNVTFGLF